LLKLSVHYSEFSIGLADTRHKIFIGTLVIATKYLNDPPPKNCRWAVWTGGIVEAREISGMEKQLLELLQFDLHFMERDLVQCLQTLTVEQQAPRSTGTMSDVQHTPLSLVTPYPIGDIRATFKTISEISTITGVFSDETIEDLEEEFIHLVDNSSSSPSLARGGIDGELAIPDEDRAGAIHDASRRLFTIDEDVN
jgi:hypothetical protein